MITALDHLRAEHAALLGLLKAERKNRPGWYLGRDRRGHHAWRRFPVDLDRLASRDVDDVPLEGQRELAVAYLGHTVPWPALIGHFIQFAGPRNGDVADARVVVQISPRHATVEVEVETPVFHIMRRFWITDGQRRAHNTRLDVAEARRGQGHGPRLVAQQAEALWRAGFTAVTTITAGRGTEWGPSEDTGYYVWPRIGYDGPLRPGDRQRLPPELAYVQSYGDLMETAAGREWWKRWGGTDTLKLDLEPGSRSRKRLAAYLAEKKIVLKKSTAGAPRYLPETLSAEDEAILDRWDDTEGRAMGEERRRDPERHAAYLRSLEEAREALERHLAEVPLQPSRLRP